MSQAKVLSGRNEKGSMRPRRIWRGICPLKRGSAADVSVRKGGGGPPDFPRRRRPRCIAPCGGVVWLAGRPATCLPCRRERRSSCTAPSTSEPCRIYRWNRECRKLRKRVRDRAPAHVPPVSRPATAIGGLAALAVHFGGTRGVVLHFENVGGLGRAGGSSRPRRPAASYSWRVG